MNLAGKSKEATGFVDSGSATLSFWLPLKSLELLKDAWQYFRGSCQKHTCLDGVRHTALRQDQTVGLPRYGCKWVQFVALTAIRLECIWSLHHKWSSSTHQITLASCETGVRIVHFCSFSRGLCRREGTSTNRCAINCAEKRSDRWTDGFSILLSLPVHLLLMKWGEKLKKRWREMICVNASDQIAPLPEHTNEAQWCELCHSN